MRQRAAKQFLDRNHAVLRIEKQRHENLMRQRLLSGEGGKQIDVSLMAAAMVLMNVTFTDFLAAGRLPQRHGNQNAAHAPAGAFEVAGGRYITIAVLRDSHWKKLCAALDLPALAEDARFSTNALRRASRGDRRNHRADP